MHIPVLLLLALFLHLLFLYFSLSFFLAHYFVDLVHLWILTLFVRLYKFKIGLWTKLVNIKVKVFLLNKLASCLGRPQIQYQSALPRHKFYALVEYLLLGFERDNISHKRVLLLVHVLFHVSCIVFDEIFEALPYFRLFLFTERLTNAPFEDFVNIIRLSKSFFLLRMLSDHTHNLTQAIWIHQSCFQLLQ